MRKGLAALGILGPLIYVFTVILGAALNPGYSHIVHAISELTVDGAPNLQLMTALFSTYNVCLLLFGFGLAFIQNRNWPTTLRAALFMIGFSALLGILMYFFPMDARDAAPSFRGNMHWLLAGTMAAMSFMSAISAAFGFRKMPELKFLAPYAFIAFAVILVTGAFTAVGAAKQFRYFGLVERLTIGSYIAWVFSLALALRRHLKAHSQS